MPLDYLIVASSDDRMAVRVAALDRSVAEATNIVGGVTQHHHVRPGLFVLTVDDAVTPQDLRAPELTIFNGTGIFGRAFAQRVGAVPIAALEPRRTSLRGTTNRPPAAEARGNFLVARHTPQSIMIFADVLGTYPIFAYESKAVFCASNNIFMLERALSALGLAPTPHLALSSYVVTLGNGAFDLTGFREIRILAPGEVVEIDQDNRAMSSVAAPTEIYSDRSLAELLDEAAHEILLNVRAVADAPFRLRICDLTGGMDSRLVVAAILHERRQDDFVFFTGGSPPNPDAIAGAVVRQQFGLRRVTNIAPRVPDVTILDGMRHYVHRTSGCFSMLYGAGGVGQPDNRDVIQIGGSFGETFRGYYGAAFSPRGNRALDRVIRATRRKADEYLDQRAIPDHLARLDHFTRSMLKAGVRPEDVPDVFYLRNRTRYHFGAQWRVTSYTRSVFHPLYSIAAIRAGYALPLPERTANRVGYELMRRFCPALAELPFAEKAWHPSLGATPVPPITRDTPPPPGHDEPGVRLFEGGGKVPPPATERGRALRAEGRNKKWIDLEVALDEFASQATDHGYAALRPVFDPLKVKAFLGRPIDEFATQYEAWTAYRLMAAYLCANRLELPPASWRS